MMVYGMIRRLINHELVKGLAAGIVFFLFVFLLCSMALNCLTDWIAAHEAARAIAQGRM